MKYLFLVNPCAGGGKGKLVWQQLTPLLTDSSQGQFDHVISRHAGQPRDLAMQAAQRSDLDCLIVVGGDGTLHEAITGLIESPREKLLPVAYIPAGTGNDFARGYGISTNPAQALQQILTNRHPHTINIGHYRDLHRQQSGIFINNFGIGFDAAIVHATNNSRAKAFLNHHHLGTFSYIFKALHVLFTQPTFSVWVQDEKQLRKFSRAFLLVASNHPYIGGGIRIAPDQRVDKEQLELVVVEKRHWLTLIWSMLMFASGRLTASRYTYLLRGQQLHYRISPAQYGQIDGVEPGKHAFDLTIDCRRYPFWQQPLKLRR